MGDQEAGADAASAGRGGENFKWAAKHPAGAGEVSGGEMCADGGAGNFKAVHVNRRMHLDGKAKLLAKFAEFCNAGFGTVAKAEVAAFVQSVDMQGVGQDAVDEVARGEAGQRGVKGQHQLGVDAVRVSRRARSGMGVSSLGAWRGAGIARGVDRR